MHFNNLSLWSSDLLTLLTLLATFVDSITSLSCEKTGPCSCQYPGGQVIDLKPIQSSKSSLRPKFSAIPGRDGNLYFYNPCWDFSLSQVDNCTEAAACVFNSKNRTYENLGSVETAEFVTEDKNNVTIVYKRVTKKGVITTRVNLCCSQLEPSQLVPRGASSNDTVYDVTLRSRCACVNGCVTSHELSAGSILLIVAAVLIILYIGVGSCYNYALGARGRYALPHHEFWSDFPMLVRDGYWFFLSPCIGDSPEYRFYERL